MMSKYEAVIGLEVHFELKTNSKLFCSCECTFGNAPNTHICPICTGLPGTLPHLNSKAVEYALMAAIATNCEIPEISAFDRKNYFYPDLPRGYQITQFYKPIARDGYIEISQGTDTKRIGIRELHLEDDAGKLVHDKARGTLVDFNRAGVPLIEIVSEPQLSSANEAKEYLKALRSIFLYLGISDCKMNEGSMRCDVNVSVRETGAKDLGVRTEIKNINSFSFVGKAIEYEILRQTSLLEAGDKIVQETRRYDERDGKTHPMRSKEDLNDYRYFPEPDIPPLVISKDEVERIRLNIPALPQERKKKYTERYALSDYEASVLTSSKELADYFEAAATHTQEHHTLANLLLGELLSLQTNEEFFCPISPEHLSTLATLLSEEKISASCAKKLLREMFCKDFEPLSRIDAEDLWQINDKAILESLVRKAVLRSPQAASDYKSGRRSAARSIVGTVMSISSGKANPRIVSELTEKILSE